MESPQPPSPPPAGHGARYSSQRLMAAAPKRSPGERMLDSLQRQNVRLDEAIRQRAAAGMQPQELLRLLISRSAIAPERLYRAFADALGLGFIDLDWIQVDPAMMEALGMDFCRRRRCLPLRRIENLIEVAVADPFDAALAVEAQNQLGLEILRLVAMPEQVDRYLVTVSINHGMVAESLASIDRDALRDEGRAMAAGRTRDQLLVFMERLVLFSAGQRASDIHLEPLEDAYRVRVRIDGKLEERVVLDRVVGQAAVNWGKVAAGMDLAERRQPQDGRFTIAAGTGKVDLRASSVPTVHGEKLVLRLMDNRRVMLDLEALSFTARIRSSWEALLAQPHGLILVTGPTGCGKTTTLYASLGHISGPAVNVTTVEDPVEYRLGGINQIQVHPKIGLTFAKVLRSCLRQDPDVILVGEIRDAETAEVAVQAALTGHLVLGTLHTNTAADAVVRLGDLGIPPYHIGQVVRGVLSQRLVRRLCHACKERQRLAPERLRRLGAEAAAPLDCWRAGGCERCGGEGFIGRVPVHELLVLDEQVARSVAHGDPTHVWLPAARLIGWRPLVHDGLVKVAAGLTTAEEVSAIVSTEEAGPAPAKA